MLRQALILATALLTIAAAPAKPRPKPAAAKPAAAAFDARDPASLISVLASAGAKGQVARNDADQVFVTVTSVAANFSVQFVECDAQGRACKAALFDNLSDQGAPTYAQLNGFTQTSVMCRAYEDRSGKPHVVYSTLLFADGARQHLLTQLAAWQGCIGEFQRFVKDPAGYLASAP
ncbi:MAG: hypothetical protein ABI655_15930 [Phenylobacterium sp.]